MITKLCKFSGMAVELRLYNTSLLEVVPIITEIVSLDHLMLTSLVLMLKILKVA